VVLRREEVILRGRGHIAFGHSTDDDGDGRIEFEVVAGFAKTDKAETAGP
jgi:hypothetical protein